MHASKPNAFCLIGLRFLVVGMHSKCRGMLFHCKPASLFLWLQLFADHLNERVHLISRGSSQCFVAETDWRKIIFKAVIIMSIIMCRQMDGTIIKLKFGVSNCIWWWSTRFIMIIAGNYSSCSSCYYYYFLFLVGYHSKRLSLWYSLVYRSDGWFVTSSNVWLCGYLKLWDQRGI